MNRSRLAAAVAILGALVAGGIVHASGQHRTAPIVYVALGDTLTQGDGADNPQTQSYPALLARHLPHGSRFLNLGLGESNLNDALDLELPDALKAHPTLVTVYLVEVDAYRRTALSSYRSDLVRLLAALTRQHARVFVANVSDPRVKLDKSDPKAERARSYNAVIASVAARYKATVVDVFAATKSLWGRRNRVAADGFHLTTKGYAALAQVFYRVMHQQGALP